MGGEPKVLTFEEVEYTLLDEIMNRCWADSEFRSKVFNDHIVNEELREELRKLGHSPETIEQYLSQLVEYGKPLRYLAEVLSGQIKLLERREQKRRELSMVD